VDMYGLLSRLLIRVRIGMSDYFNFASFRVTTCPSASRRAR
jgi:hypothetical protein